MDPVSIAGAWSIAKAAGEAAKKLHELAKEIKDRDLKEQIHTVIDQLHGLKRSASELEDENRELREKLRFKSDEFEFSNPFWYEKKHPDRPLCPICFAKGIPAPMSEPEDQGQTTESRMCLVCRCSTRTRPYQHQPSPIIKTNFFS
jgi:hypothetical protein